MTPADYDAFCAVVVGFAEIKGKHLSAAAIEIYWRSMQHWPLDDFRAAAEQLLRTCEFMPTPKDFEDLRRAAKPTAGEAWLAALDGSRQILPTPDRAPMRYANTSGDPLIDRTVAMLGGFALAGAVVAVGLAPGGRLGPDRPGGERAVALGVAPAHNPATFRSTGARA